MSKTVSPLRYPGGKVKLYGYVKRILEENNLIGQTYIEPFAGGAGLALKLLLNNDVQRIVINDLDRAIYSFWYSVLHETDNICKFVNDIDLNIVEWNHQKQIYLNQEQYDNLTLGKATFYLNRTNRSGVISGGVIGGQYQEGNYLMNARFNRKELIKRIEEIAKNSNKIHLYNLDVLEFIKPTILKKYRKTFINFDPPYVEKGGQLYKNFFKEDDHKALRNAIKQCNRKWMVTYDVCDLTTSLYNQFRHSYIDINYSVNKSRKAKELIVFSDNLLLPSNIILE